VCVCVCVLVDSSQLSGDELSSSSSSNLRQSFNSRCSQHRVTSFIGSHVQSAYLKAESSHELHYILPADEAKKGGFERLFAALDRALSELHVASYGIADTSLEEVFVKITSQTTTGFSEDGSPQTSHTHTTGDLHT